MKVVNIVLEIKEGLPNYSSRTATVTVLADADESLDVSSYISGLQAQIKDAFRTESLRYEIMAQAKEAAAPPPPAPAVIETKKRGRPQKRVLVPEPEPLHPAAQSVADDFFAEE